jgi:hypothetical protein
MGGNADRPVGADVVIWAARRTVQQHAEPPVKNRRTGVCAHCCEADICPTLLAAIHYLRRAAGFTR